MSSILNGCIESRIQTNKNLIRLYRNKETTVAKAALQSHKEELVDNLR